MTNEEIVTDGTGMELPILYKSVVPLMSDVHKDLKLIKVQDYSFAAKVNAVPIVMQELPIAEKFFPIVFVGGGSGIMLAVMGIRNDQNLFVDDKGEWRGNSYIPAYIRRYPFFTARPDDKSEPIICIDETSSILSPEGETALFENNKGTEAMRNMADFIFGYQKHLEVTNEYVLMLEEKGLLSAQEMSFKIGDKVKANLNGFMAIDRPKFDELDGDTLKEWLTKGWVDSSIIHLASGSNFDFLWQMDMERNKY